MYCLTLRRFTEMGEMNVDDAADGNRLTGLPDAG
jgi:hypothetical protein